jgi:hypothetical protein
MSEEEVYKLSESLERKIRELDAELPNHPDHDDDCDSDTAWMRGRISGLHTALWMLTTPQLASNIRRDCI